jgi:hypothetical protein
MTGLGKGFGIAMWAFGNAILRLKTVIASTGVMQSAIDPSILLDAATRLSGVSLRRSKKKKKGGGGRQTRKSTRC